MPIRHRLGRCHNSPKPMHEAPLMRVVFAAIDWIVVGLTLGFVLTRYASGGMMLAFVQQPPGCLWRWG